MKEGYQPSFHRDMNLMSLEISKNDWYFRLDRCFLLELSGFGEDQILIVVRFIKNDWCFRWKNYVREG